MIRVEGEDIVEQEQIFFKISMKLAAERRLARFAFRGRVA